MGRDGDRYHGYVMGLFNMFKENTQFWPYKLKIEKMNVILNKILFNVNLEIKIGFKNNVGSDAK